MKTAITVLISIAGLNTVSAQKMDSLREVNLATSYTNKWFFEAGISNSYGSASTDFEKFRNLQASGLYDSLKFDYNVSTGTSPTVFTKTWLKVGYIFPLRQAEYCSNLYFSAGFSHFYNYAEAWAGKTTEIVEDTLTSSQSGQQYIVKNTRDESVRNSVKSVNDGLSVRIGTKILPEKFRLNIEPSIENTIYYSHNATIGVFYSEHTSPAFNSQTTLNSGYESQTYGEEYKLSSFFTYGLSGNLNLSWQILRKHPQFELLAHYSYNTYFSGKKYANGSQNQRNDFGIGLRFYAGMRKI